MEKIEIGFVDYINCLPVYYAFNQKEYIENYNLVKRKPAELNNLMSLDKLFVSNVSSIEYARNNEKYFILPDICISSLKEVHSVVLVSKRKIENLNNTKITLTNASGTSQVLLKIILNEMYGFNNEYLEIEPDLDKMLMVSEGALLIGDDALKIEKRDDLYIYDLGKLWREFTGYPFVFALFIINKKWAIENDLLAKKIVYDFQKSLKLGEESLGEIIKDCEPRFPLCDMKTYFKDINYYLFDDCKKGLKLFFKKAFQLGLSKECDNLEFLDYK